MCDMLGCKPLTWIEESEQPSGFHGHLSESLLVIHLSWSQMPVPCFTIGSWTHWPPFFTNIVRHWFALLSNIVRSWFPFTALFTSGFPSLQLNSHCFRVSLCGILIHFLFECLRGLSLHYREGTITFYLSGQSHHLVKMQVPQIVLLIPNVWHAGM